MTTNLNTSVADRALTLLGQGVPASVVAATCGVTESRISQLVSDPEFAAQIAELRFSSLQKHNERDSQYDKIEDSLIKRLEDLLPLMMRPMEVLKAIQVINAAKRRGASAPDQVVQQQTFINLNIPTTLIQKFQVNQNNHVIQAGEQTLLTLQSGSLLERVKGKEQQNDLARLVTPENSISGTKSGAAR
jgi:hypothetical protein